MIFGEGRQSHIRGTGPFFRVRDLDNFVMRSMGLSTDVANGEMVDLRRVDSIRFKDCYVTGGADGTYMAKLVSGIASVDVCGCWIAGRGIAPWKAVGTSDPGEVGLVSLRSNFVSAAVVQFCDVIESLSIRGNTMINVDVDEEVPPA